MRAKSICVLGGSGFVGRHALPQLIRHCRSVRVLTRNRESCRDLLVPGIDVHQVDDFSSATLSEQFAHCDTVINLTGILNERPGAGRSFAAVHVDLAHSIALAAKANNVRRIIQMSALHADAEHGTSAYLRSKGQAETALAAATDTAVSYLQPSVIFGPGDSFFNRFAGLLAIAPVLPLARPGAKFAPVYVGDVVATICAELAAEHSGTKAIQLCGPDVFTLRELVQYTASVLGLRRIIIGLPDTLGKLQGLVMGALPGQAFTLDNYRSLLTDSVCSTGCPTQATSVDQVVPGYLGQSDEQTHLQELRRRARR